MVDPPLTLFATCPYHQQLDIITLSLKLRGVFYHQLGRSVCLSSQYWEDSMSKCFTRRSKYMALQVETNRDISNVSTILRLVKLLDPWKSKTMSRCHPRLLRGNDQSAMFKHIEVGRIMLIWFDFIYIWYIIHLYISYIIHIFLLFILHICI